MHFVLNQIILIQKHKILSKEAKIILKLAGKLKNNILCAPIDPDLVFSADNTSLCIYEGTKKDKNKQKIENSDYEKDRGFTNTYKADNNQINHII